LSFPPPLAISKFQKRKEKEKKKKEFNCNRQNSKKKKKKEKPTFLQLLHSPLQVSLNCIQT